MTPKVESQPSAVSSGRKSGSIRRSPSSEMSATAAASAVPPEVVRPSRRSSTIHSGMSSMPTNPVNPVVAQVTTENGSVLRDSVGSVRDSARESGSTRERRRRTGTGKKSHATEDGLEGVSAEVLASVEAEIAMLLKSSKK